MLSQSEFARQIDGPALDAEITRLARKGGGWLDVAMQDQGWESLATTKDVSPTLRDCAWRRGNVYAFDANETNFLKSDADGQIYPIDLIVWRLND